MTAERTRPLSGPRMYSNLSVCGFGVGTAAGSPSTSTDLIPQGTGPRRVIRQAIPDEVLHDERLNKAISVLPSNYNFEIHKTVWRIKQVRPWLQDRRPIVHD